MLIGILANFSVPVIIGSQGGIDVLAVLIFRTMNAPGGPRFDQMIVLNGAQGLSEALAQALSQGVAGLQLARNLLAGGNGNGSGNGKATSPDTTGVDS